MNKPNFNEIKNFQEFNKYYWYYNDLKDICRELKINNNGTKLELLHNIEEYFKGNAIIKPKSKKIKLKVVDNIDLDTKILECNFSFNQKFRDFFAKETNTKIFKFNTDMVATVKKVKQTNDFNFTLRDLLRVYNKEIEYAKNDNSACQWNKFLKDFCNDKNNSKYTNKLKVASILWKIVRDSENKKIYTKEIVKLNEDKLKEYLS